MPRQLLTLGQIADRARLPIHRIDYFLRSRGIKPVARAGQLRVFGQAALDRVLAELGSATEPASQTAIS